MKKTFFILSALLLCIPIIGQNADSQRKTTEDAFISKMKAITNSGILTCICPDTTAMSKAERKDYYIYPGESYILDEISSATYYGKAEGNFKPLCDKCYPTETMANRLLLSNRELPDGEIRLTFQKYRYDTDSVRIQFKQFVSFCKSEGCKTYIGIEKMGKQEMLVDVFLYNPLIQCLHIFTLTCPLEHVADDGLSICGTAWLFIPTSNIRELMGKELPKDFMQKLIKKTKG